MGKSKTRKSSVSGYMLTDAQLTELIEKSTVKATEKPGQNPSSQTGATTPTGSGGTGSDYPSQGEAGDSNGGGVELPIILFD